MGDLNLCLNPGYLKVVLFGVRGGRVVVGSSLKEKKASLLQTNKLSELVTFLSSNSSDSAAHHFLQEM